MRTLQYELQSQPGTYITVTRRGAKEAEALLKNAAHHRPQLTSRNHPSLLNHRELHKALLSPEEISSKKRDQAYLITCMYWNGQNRGVRAVEIDSGIKSALKNLEQKAQDTFCS